MSPRVLTVGETMALLDPVEDGPLELGRALTLRVAGAESNFAIALARLGVAHVLAVDEDPDAIAAATTNADRNGVGAAVECRVDDAATLDVGQVPLVVANLITAAHRRLADRYARYVAPSGRLILSGILDAEAAEIEETMRARGWRPDSAVAREGWSTLLFTGRTCRI